MSCTTTTITRTTNKAHPELKALGLRAQVSTFGSFFAVRINDPEGQCPVKLFDAVTRTVGRALYDAGYVADMRANSFGWLADGCVSNWVMK